MLYLLEVFAGVVAISIGALTAMIVLAKLFQIARWAVGLAIGLSGRLWARRFLRDIRKCL